MYIYSCKTHAKDSRCLVVIENNEKQCLSEKCKEARASFVNSRKSELFSCEHCEACVNAVLPTKVYHLSEQLIDLYPADISTKDSLRQLIKSSNFPSAAQLSETTFCMNGFPTSSNPVGFCHIKIVPPTVQGRQPKYLCYSKDCKGYSSKTRDEKQRKICLHVHTLLAVIGSFPTTDHEEAQSIAGILPPNVNESVPTTDDLAQADLAEYDPGSLSRTSTIMLNMEHKLPYVIPKEILDKIAENDSRRYLSGDSENAGWPLVVIPDNENCNLCGSVLGQPRSHPGQKKGEHAFYITNVNPFLPVSILVKICPNPLCKGMHQVFPYNIGLFNVSDKILITFDILLEWREEFKRGIPLTVAIESKLSILTKKTNQAIPSLGYVTDLLYNGFYCFEVITERKLDDQICGICGIVGEVYLGDGNEKNCCSRKELTINADHEDITRPNDGHLLSLDKFLLQLKRRWIESTSFTRTGIP